MRPLSVFRYIRHADPPEPQFWIWDYLGQYIPTETIRAYLRVHEKEEYLWPLVDVVMVLERSFESLNLLMKDGVGIRPVEDK